MRESENVELERVRDVCYLLSVVHFPAHELLIYIYTCIYMHTHLTACSSSLQAMLEDKLRSTDWDATYSAIEETVCKESYLEWLRENERKRGGHSGAQVHVRTHVHVYNGCLYSLIHIGFRCFSMHACRCIALCRTLCMYCDFQQAL